MNSRPLDNPLEGSCGYGFRAIDVRYKIAEILIDEFNQGESLEARLAHDADQLAFLIELKDLADLGYAAPRTWIPNVQQRIQTDIGRSLADIILTTASDMWWRQKFIDRSDQTQ